VTLCGRYTPKRVEGLTGVPEEQVVRAARLLAEHRPVAYYAWSGVGQHTNATQTDRAISLLYALTGSFDTRGGNVIHSHPAVNDVSGIELLAESQLDKAIDRLIRPLGPGRQGWVASHALCRAIIERDPYPVSGLVAFGSNLLLSQPGAELVRRALGELDFVVLCDMFLTPTAQFADIVLPVASAWEREGLRVGFEVTQEAEQLIQLRAPAVPPLGEARPDIEIVFDLAERLGLAEHFFHGDIDAALEYILEPTGIRIDELRARPEGIQVPLETRYRKYREKAGDGFGFVGFATPSGRVEIYSQEFLEHGENPLPDYVPPAMSGASSTELTSRYPLVLTTAKVLHFCHSQHRSIARLRRANPDPLVELNGDAAAERSIADGDWVVIETPRGAMRARARLNPRLSQDVVCAQFGWWQDCSDLGLPGYSIDGSRGSNYNALIGVGAVDPISGSTPLRSYICELRREGSPGQGRSEGQSSE
jgi:anaerobic selenocysteine-containing dehydrogenase